MDFCGAKWWKCDFHVHTPASFDYGKDESNLKDISPREWLLKLMEKDVDCVAITDHNSGEWIDILKYELDKIREENCEGYREVYLFPGIEITVHGGVHLLGIFDIDTSSSDIAELIGAIDYTGKRGNSDGCTNKSFDNVVQEIIKRGGIAIPAHVDIESGIFKEQTGNTLKESIKSEGILALEVHDITYNKPQIYTDLKLNHSEVIGSDSHKPIDIGKYFTWVKMEKPSLDALWLALHDGRDGVIRYDDNIIRNNPNDIRNRFFIKSISIQNGSKIGLGINKFEIEFSPWMSTIIGGRGSGKSSIINFIRLALKGEYELTDSLKSEFKEFAKVAEGRNKPGMLRGNTNIRIEMFKDGRDISICWRDNDLFEEHFDSIRDEWVVKGKAVDIQQRFPVRIFNQKELYEITKDPQVILRLIDEQISKNRIDLELISLKESWTESKYKENKYKKEIENKGIIEARLNDLTAKMKVFEESDFSNIIEEYKNIKNIEYSINNLTTEFNNNIRNLNNISKEIKMLNIVKKGEVYLDENFNNLLIEKVGYLNCKIKEIFNDIESISEEKENLNLITNNLLWNKEKIKIEDKYNELVNRIGNDQLIDVNIYSKLVEDKVQLEKEFEKINSIEALYIAQVKESRVILNNIYNTYINIRKKRIQLINEWNSKKMGIDIELEIMADINNAEIEFRQIIRKTDTTFKKDICEIDEDGNRISGFIYDICNLYDSNANIDEVFKSVIEKISGICDMKSNIYKKYSKNFKKHMDKLYKDNISDINNLMVWVPEDRVKLAIVDNGRKIDVEQGSAGQRTAAILALILSLDDRPLIIDQPEDDLDTKRISDLVVTGIRRLKLKQQVIVVTHNPNIPVNGASEQVLHLAFLKGQINNKAHGALQKKYIREAICDVMEGGKVALDNRYHRISKALE